MSLVLFITTVLVIAVTSIVRMINANVKEAQRLYAREQEARVQLQYHYEKAAKARLEWISQAEQQKSDNITAKRISRALSGN